jgi:phage-related baseplate assembly protein
MPFDIMGVAAGKANGRSGARRKEVIMTKLTIADIADEMLKAFDLDDALCGLAMERLHNRVKAQETDPEMATKMLNEGMLAALRKSNERELREFARMKFESFSVAGRMPN